MYKVQRLKRNVIVKYEENSLNLLIHQLTFCITKTYYFIDIVHFIVVLKRFLVKKNNKISK